MSDRRRLFFITTSSVEQGPYPELALPALAADGWEITVAAPGVKNSILRKVRPFACREIELGISGRTRLVREMRTLATMVAARFGHYDVIYLNSVQAGARAALVLAGPKLGKKLVYHSPDFFDRFTYPAHFRLERSLCRKADLHINNEFHRGYISQAVYGMKCPIITAPPNLPRDWPIPPRNPETRRLMAGGAGDAFILMLHGGFSELRMVPELLQALTLLPQRVRLVMTSSAPREQEVEQLLRRFQLSDRVLRLPRVGFQELLAHTVNADCGVLLYQNNDLGNFFTAPGRMTEYLACGLPVLASNHTGLENLVLRYGLGETVLAESPEGVAAGVLRLEQRLRAGALDSTAMRGQFASHFAFDHWEVIIQMAFRGVSLARAPGIPEPPAFPWLPNP